MSGRKITADAWGQYSRSGAGKDALPCSTTGVTRVSSLEVSVASSAQNVPKAVLKMLAGHPVGSADTVFSTAVQVFDGAVGEKRDVCPAH